MSVAHHPSACQVKLQSCLIYVSSVQILVKQAPYNLFYLSKLKMSVRSLCALCVMILSSGSSLLRSGAGGAGSDSKAAAEELSKDERLNGLEPRMIELIMNEVDDPVDVRWSKSW